MAEVFGARALTVEVSLNEEEAILLQRVLSEWAEESSLTGDPKVTEKEHRDRRWAYSLGDSIDNALIELVR